MGADVGVSFPDELASTRTNTGISTNCDQWLPADTLHDGTPVPLPLERCSPRTLPASPSRFDLDAGVLAGVSLGYALRDFRFEAEYFRREQGGESVSLEVPGDEKQQEFVVRSEKIGDFRADYFFANLYYDFRELKWAGTTPYLGVGLGWMKVRMDYSGTSIRTDDANRLRELGRNANAAGLASLADDGLSDTLTGYQWIAGLDYAWNERWTLGVKFRYGDSFGEFEDGGNAWKLLRGHASTVGPTPATGANLPVFYGIEADDLRFWAISLSFRFAL